MWYEEDDQFVRAPTPQGYDNLVKDLESRDSVIFESIQLPSSKKGQRDSMSSTRASSMSIDNVSDEPMRVSEPKLSNVIEPIEEETPFQLTDTLTGTLTLKDSIPSQPISKVKTSKSSFVNSIELGSTMNSLDVSDIDMSIRMSASSLIRMKEKIEELQKLNKQKDAEIIQKDLEIKQLKAQADAQDPRISSTLNYKEMYENAYFELTKLKEALEAPAKRRIGSK